MVVNQRILNFGLICYSPPQLTSARARVLSLYSPPIWVDVYACINYIEASVHLFLGPQI